jgi:trk system potassium uptake protein
MHIIVVGCGRVGSELAYRVFQKQHRITVIDIQQSAFSSLPPDFRGRTILGEALNQDVLHRAGIESADGLAAVTSSDTTNCVVAHLARSIYHVPNVIVRNYQPHFRSLFDVFNLQVVSSSSWGAQRIEELLYHPELRTVFSAGNGEVEVYEFTIPEHWAGRELGEIVPGEGCSPVALTRAGQALLPDCDTLVELGDVVLVSATFDGIRALRANLLSQREV